jgi:hypothetical protein
MRTALASFYVEGNGGSWNPGAVGDDWIGGGGGCGGDCGCGGSCGGDCGCEGGGGSCGGKPSGGCGDQPSGGPSGGSGQLPLIPDYDGQIWDGPRTFAAFGTFHPRDTVAAHDDLDYCYVNGAWKAGYKHPTRHAICIDREFNACFTCESDFAQPCSEWCNQQAKECRQGDLACASACLGFDFGAFTSPEEESQFISCYNQCIAPIMRSTCASCKNCRVSNPRCPYCLTSYWQVPDPPRKRDPNYDPNTDYCSEPLLDQEDVGDEANYCCLLHDKCYEVGGTWGDKLACDLSFWGCLVFAWNPLWSIPGATLYFVGVTFGGISHFNWHHPQRPSGPMQDAFGSPWGHVGR